MLCYMDLKRKIQEEAYAEGHAAGYAEGSEAGFDEGFTEGKDYIISETEYALSKM